MRLPSSFLLDRCFYLSRPRNFCTPAAAAYLAAAAGRTFGSSGRSRRVDGRVDTRGGEYVRNYERSVLELQQYERWLGVALAGGGERARERHAGRHGKLLPADRLRLLLDDPSGFLELSAFAGLGMEYGDVPRAGVITGIGKISGKQCMILANDATVKGGSVYPITLKKQLRAQEIALDNHLPCVYLVDSGGAFLPLQAQIFPDKDHGGRVFYNEAVMSSLNIPQIAVVCGHCTAGGAYIPTMASEAVIINKMGAIFLGGPPLVQAALGEVVTTEELGGAKMHSSVSGCIDHYADNEEEAFHVTREIVSCLNITCHKQPQQDTNGIEDPEFDSTEILGLIPAAEHQHTLDIHKVIARLTDGSQFQEFKARFGSTLVTGFAHINGYLVGIVGNKGELNEQAATKGTHFVQLCCQRHIPIIFLQNTAQQSMTNINSTEYGAYLASQVKSQAQMLAAVSCAAVPKITIIIGNAFGCSHYVMGGKSVSPSFIFCWPNARIGAVEVSQIMLALEEDPNVDSSSAEKLCNKYKRELTSLYAASRLWNDGIILPQETRKVIGQCLDIVMGRKNLTSQQAVLRM